MGDERLKNAPERGQVVSSEDAVAVPPESDLAALRAPTAAGGRRRKKSSPGQRGRTAFIVAFLSPAVILYGLFVILPLIQSFVLSLYRWRGVSANRRFIGTANFEKLFADEIFWRALKNNLWLLGFAGIALVGLGVLIAHGVHSGTRMGRGLRSIYLFPQVISMVVVAVLWMFLYNPSFGLLDASLRAVGLERWAKPWLGDPSSALPAVGVAFVWYALGFYIMLFAAGLQAVPKEVTEAAELDGSSGLHRFRRITWPMLWAIKRIAIVYIVINVMNVFALVYVMTEGGPDRATETMLTYLYKQGFKNFEFGYATAIAVANFVVAMALAFIVMAAFRRNPESTR
jgi:N-acetylglucosamine transport system permease protein